MRTYFVKSAILLFTFILTGLVSAQVSNTAAPVKDSDQAKSSVIGMENAPGDRIITRQTANTNLQDALAVSIPITEDYLLGPGDVLNIVVQGKANLNYHVNLSKSGDSNASVSDLDETVITPAGQVIFPVAGPVQAAGKTIGQLKVDASKALSDYFKSFQVNVAVSKPRMMKVFVSGTVDNPGARTLPGTATVIEALLAAGIGPNGSTRRIELRRNGTVTPIDVYSIVIKGQLEKNVVLQPGDTLYVPAASQWIAVNGEVTRPGRYELLPGMKLKDVLDSAMGMTPAAVPSKTAIERSAGQGESRMLYADASKACASPDCRDDVDIANGDKIRVPSLSEYMPMVRMVGEFVGKAVFQRTIGQGEEQVLNKSGVYLLAQGKTAGEVIRETGGVTPQADLKNAKIRRTVDGKTEEIALDLDRLLMQNDSAADVVLKSGDTVILPALADKVHVLGSVAKPGSYAYTPNRKLMDYVGDAGGQSTAGRLSHVRVIRGDVKHPVIMTCNLTKGIKNSPKDNPVLEPGDAVFVPEHSFNGWRDIVGVLTTVRLFQTLTN